MATIFTYSYVAGKYLEIENEAVQAAELVLVDNGLDDDDAAEVLRAIGYVLLDCELYPAEVM